ncbi:MAG: biotin--[acetyl-CoA-carboxylase] ligase [Burkholderiales bacterium]
MRPAAFPLLRLLADGEFHSGQDLARSLEMSRTSVWHVVRDLDAAGLTTHKVRGRGYRLVDPPQWLDRERVYAMLGAYGAQFEVVILDCVDSTNTALLDRAAAGAPHGLCLAAELQTMGRGRRGRAWHSKLGHALTFSVLWRFNQSAAFLTGLSLAVGIAIARTLRTVGVTDIALKWPNDVLWKRRKVAGTLIEIQGDVLGPCAAVIGIGANLKLSAAARARIGQPAADLSETDQDVPDRSALLAHLLAQLAQVLHSFGADGFAVLREEWENLHAYHNETVQLMLPDGQAVDGRVLGVDGSGGLLLNTAAGRQTFHVGEISLRGLL